MSDIETVTVKSCSQCPFLNNLNYPMGIHRCNIGDIYMSNIYELNKECPLKSRGVLVEVEEC